MRVDISDVFPCASRDNERLYTSHRPSLRALIVHATKTTSFHFIGHPDYVD